MHEPVILVALGANLPHPDHGTPAATLRAALARFGEVGLDVVACSRLYESAPVPPSDQPWFVNAVARVETGLDAGGVLAALHGIEAGFGRVRRARWEARVLDLDLIDYRGTVSSGPAAPDLPHPRMQDRAFVLQPMADLVPGWVHPRNGESLEALLARLPPAAAARVCVEPPPMP